MTSDDRTVYERLDYIRELSRDEIVEFLLIQFGIAYGRMRNYTGIGGRWNQETFTKEEVDKHTTYYFCLGRECLVRSLNELGLKKKMWRMSKNDEAKQKKNHANS